MKLSEAMELLKPYVGKRFDSFLPQDVLMDLRTNKGNVGQLLERLIGLANTSSILDFEDGELKTNKCDSRGKPLETMFITQIASSIDEILRKRRFEETHLYNKIKNLLYVPVSKEGNEGDWFILPIAHVNLSDSRCSILRSQLEADYYSIADQLLCHIQTSPDGFIHTSNGEFIQIRSKDSMPYHPIYSMIVGREVSNKNHAFYFKKKFMHYLNIHLSC
ncbi:MAG TPA: MutH/Sau3AI family endonuclease [Pseudobacteroides sp.]|nr:MutH/Sau3AI family endonuclease [Pseudobacteroides sp.]